MLEFVQVNAQEQVKAVADMAQTIWVEHYRFLPVGQTEYMLNRFQSAQAISSAIEEDGYSYYIVRDNGMPLGYFGFVLDNRGLFLSKLYLYKWARGKGVGKACIDYVCDKARRFSAKRVHLTVNKHNADSIAAYQKWGFSTYAAETEDIGGGYAMEDFLMEKSL